MELLLDHSEQYHLISCLREKIFVEIETIEMSLPNTLLK